VLFDGVFEKSIKITETRKKIQHYVYEVNEQIVRQCHVGCDETFRQRVHHFNSHFVQERLGTPSVRKSHQDHALQDG